MNVLAGGLGDRYQLEELIGRGGMAVVWRARDTRLHRLVAVKEIVLPRDLGSDRDAVQQRALREARAAARVADAAAVTVFDVIDEGDRVFIVMELIDAPSLDRVVRDRGVLMPQAAAAVGVRLCDALAAAHRVGVIHRDVKPSNVLLPAAATDAKLADFGIASIRADPRITATGMAVGSLPYMAPEQAMGQPATEASDRWALGATLYFAMEGVSPFDRGSTIDTLTAVTQEPPRSCATTGPLTPVILSLLVKEPGLRPELADVRDSLRAVCERRPERTVVAPAAPTTVDHTDRSIAPTGASQDPASPRRHRVPWMGAVAVIAVVCGGLAAALVGYDEPAPSAPIAPVTMGATEFTRWVDYTDPATGFQLRYPEGWQLTRPASNRTDLRDPGGDIFVSVGWTDRPADDPVAAWRELTSDFAAETPGYTEVRLEAAAFKGLPAAEWEFTQVDNDTTLRTLDIAVVTDGHGYALQFRAHDERWRELADVRAAIMSGFVPADRGGDETPPTSDRENLEDDD